MEYESTEREQDKKADRAFRTISEVSEELGLPTHVLRFWETKFEQLSPIKRGGNRRYYRPEDVVLLKKIDYLLHQQGYKIQGVQKLLKEGGLNDAVPQEISGIVPKNTMREEGDKLQKINKMIDDLEEMGGLLKRLL